MLLWPYHQISENIHAVTWLIQQWLGREKHWSCDTLNIASTGSRELPPVGRVIPAHQSFEHIFGFSLCWRKCHTWSLIAGHLSWLLPLLLEPTTKVIMLMQNEISQHKWQWQRAITTGKSIRSIPLNQKKTKIRILKVEMLECNFCYHLKYALFKL